MGIYDEPAEVDPDAVANLGPLAPLAGTWEGDEGIDIAPKLAGPDETRYRERLVLEPIPPVLNGPQLLYGLRYATTAWPLGEADPFHEEVGYWLFEPATSEVMRCFMVPRGVTLIAGATVAPGARSFELTAEKGASPYGILSSGFLTESFDTVRFEVRITVESDGCFAYNEDTQLKIQGEGEIFHHTDRNRLTRVARPAQLARAG